MNRDDDYPGGPYPYGNYREPDEAPPRSPWPGVLLAVVLAVIAGAFYYYWVHQIGSPRATQQAPSAAKSPVAEPEKPAIRHPVPEAPATEPLPTLDHSDARVGEWIAGLIGARAFRSFVNRDQLVRRIVATVDSLPRKLATVRMRPVKPVPGSYRPDPRNASRYAAHVKAFLAIDTDALVQGYRAWYPLFQDAYRELGYPDGYFNDRLIEAIDDMLAAPELRGFPSLERPKVLYVYDDPALEARSAGQKFIMRLSRDDAAKVKAKLREIREALQ